MNPKTRYARSELMFLGSLRRYRHLQLLIALSLTLFVNPFLKPHVGGYLVNFFLLLTLVAAVVGCSTRRWHVVMGVGFAVSMTTVSFYREYVGASSLNLGHTLFGLTFVPFLTYLVLRDVFSAGRVDADKICGALSAYLFMGITWAFAYALLEGLEPGSLSGIQAAAHPAFQSFDRFIGYSFVTLTTLGYGNVVPTTPRAEALAIAEAIVGQIYLTVLVARLVALSLHREEGDARS